MIQDPKQDHRTDPNQNPLMEAASRLEGRDLSQDLYVQRFELSRRLRLAREYVGLTQEDVAGVLGVPRPAITGIESGMRKVEAIELSRLSVLYGRSFESLLTGNVPAKEERVAFIARATRGLTDADLEELARFAAFLSSNPKVKISDS